MNIKKEIKRKIDQHKYQAGGGPILPIKKVDVKPKQNPVNKPSRSTLPQKTNPQPFTPVPKKAGEIKDKPIMKSQFLAQSKAFIPPAHKAAPPVKDLPVELKDYGPYVKEENVDYDVVICVTSFERYKKVRRIIKQLHTQESKYTFKFCMINDASLDERYKTLKTEFPNIVYLENDVNGGKVNYWRTVNKLWEVGGTFKSHGFLQIDDDFILCDNFLDRLMDAFFSKKEENNGFMVFSYHIYGYDRNKPQADWWYNGVSIAIDGGTLFDARFVKMFNYHVEIGEKLIAAHTSTFVWDTIVQHIRNFGVRVYRLPNSLAWHDGNFDSKLNEQARRHKKSYTKNFIDGSEKYDLDKEVDYYD